MQIGCTVRAFFEAPNTSFIINYTYVIINSDLYKDISELKRMREVCFLAAIK